MYGNQAERCAVESICGLWVIKVHTNTGISSAALFKVLYFFTCLLFLYFTHELVVIWCFETLVILQTATDDFILATPNNSDAKRFHCQSAAGINRTADTGKRCSV